MWEMFERGDGEGEEERQMGDDRDAAEEKEGR